MCVFFSGEEPESMRSRMRYEQQILDTMMLDLRLADMPRILIATTPLVSVRPAFGLLILLLGMRVHGR